MDTGDALKINLASLRIVDSSISSIVDSANQVALYKYISEASKWEKTEIEGTLFVYMRTQKPQHGFMVMNRLSTTNLVEPITEKLDFQDQTPFLLYRNGNGHIYGMWFYEERNCVKIFKLLTSLSQLAFTKPEKSSSIRQRSFSESNRKQQKQENSQMDIISLLSKAQDEYDKKSAAKGSPRVSKTTQHTTNGEIIKPTPVRMNGAVGNINESTPLTLGMLFAKAGGIEKKPNEDLKDFNSRVRSFTASNSNALPSNSLSNTESILQNLLSNSAHTLHHIEGIQNKGKTPQIGQLNRSISVDNQIMSVASLEKDLKEKLNLLPKTTADVNKIDLGVLSEVLTLPVKSDPINIPIITPGMLESSSYSSVPTAAMVGSFLDKSDGFYNTNTASYPLLKDCASFSPTQLLSPMDLLNSSQKKNLSSSHSPEPASMFFNGKRSSHEDLLHPQALLNGMNTGHLQPSGRPSVTPLNKDQFKEALVYMIQNDDEFVIQLHECYVKSLKTHLNLNSLSLS